MEMGKWMAGLRSAPPPLVAAFSTALVLVSAEKGLPEQEHHLLARVVNYLWRPDDSSYHHVWPDMAFGWRIVLGSLIGFFGAAFGSVGGVGGGGIFVPMLTLVIGFDAKSSTAISKCMIMGAAGSTVYYNLKLRHPTLEMPIIDYDLALLFQPMLMLGISIGVAFNVVFADWMVTVLLIILFLGTSSKAFLKGVETWKKETIAKKEAARRAESKSAASDEVEYRPLPSGPENSAKKQAKAGDEAEVSQPVQPSDPRRRRPPPPPPPRKTSDSPRAGAHHGEHLLEGAGSPGLRLGRLPGPADRQELHGELLGVLLDLEPAPGPCFGGGDAVPERGAVHGEEGDLLQGGRGDQLDGPPAARLLLMRRPRRRRRRPAGARRRVHSGAALSRAGHPSTGLERDGDIRHDLLIVDVRGGVLPPAAVPCPLCSLLRGRGNGGGFHRAARGEEADHLPRPGLAHHLHPRLHHLRQRRLSGWSGHLQHGEEDPESRVHGLRESLQISRLARRVAL